MHGSAFPPTLATAFLLIATAAVSAQPKGGTNPLLKESALPYHLPPFAAIRNEHFAAAFDQGMAEELAEVAAIANNKAEPTFDNTIVAMELSGKLLGRAQRVFGIITSSLTNPALEKLDEDYSPKFAAHSDAILLNSALFARVHKLWEKRESMGLDAPSKKLLEDTHRNFVRAGAALSEAGKAKMRAINADLAKLSTQFRQNVLKEINASSVMVNTKEELAGLSEGAIKAAADAAKAAGAEGKYAIRLVNTSGQPPLDQLQNAAVRKRVMEASLARGMRGNEFDNRAVVISMARRRAELAELLGYANFAAYQVEEQTANSVDTVNKLLARIVPAAVANARKEAAALQASAGKAPISAGDWSYYTEKVRLAKYQFDEGQLRPYYELKRVLVDGVFYAATRLYGITFKERRDLHGYSPDMVAYEVFNADGKPLGLFLGDYYARPNKRGGAWMNSYVSANGLNGNKPVVGNHLNIPKPPAGEPTLLTHDEVNTMFHEFGHALHGLFSTAKYPSHAGTQVPRDFVEFPSQVNEMWATWPEILEHYAVHYQTGKPMPKELLDKVSAAEKFNQGFTTTEYIAASVMDQAWHQLKPREIPDDVAKFEASVFARQGLDFALVPPRYRSTYFSHVFAGGYAAGYYSYIWSEVLDADTVEWFKQNGGLKRANGDRFRNMVLSQGGSADALVLYKAFRGAEPDTNPLLRRRALID
jgi:peptidyl-dipeptidase Dcp